MENTFNALITNDLKFSYNMEGVSEIKKAPEGAFKRC
jgi:hypothetical protein